MLLHLSYRVMLKTSLTQIFGAYRGLWNKCKRLKGYNKTHQFYSSNETIRLKLVEKVLSKPLTVLTGPKDLFPDNDVDYHTHFTFYSIYQITSLRSFVSCLNSVK